MLDTAIEEWRERAAEESDGDDDEPEEEGAQVRWHLAKGFDKVARFLGGEDLTHFTRVVL